MNEVGTPVLTIRDSYYGFPVYDFKVTPGKIALVMSPDNTDDLSPETRDSVVYEAMETYLSRHEFQKTSEENANRHAQVISRILNLILEDQWLEKVQYDIIDYVGGECEGYEVSVEWAWEMRLVSKESVLEWRTLTIAVEKPLNSSGGFIVKTVSP